MGSRQTAGDLVSVIVPCYNQARYLGECIGSLVRQTHGNWECIIVYRDGSDNTREVAEELAKSDTRVRCVEQTYRGLADARNCGLDVMRGQYVQFLDADDTLCERKFELQLAAMSHTDELAVSYSDFKCYSEDPDVQVPEFYKDPRLSESDPCLDIAQRFGHSLAIPVHCLFFDARVFREHGVRFDAELPNHEDFACWIRVFRLNPVVVRVDEPLVLYRWHRESMTQDKRRMQRGFEFAIRKAVLDFRDNPKVATALAGRLGVPAEYVYGEMSGIPRAKVTAKLAGIAVARKLVPGKARRAIKRRLDNAA